MYHELLHIVNHSVMISLFVFVMMVLTDFINVWSGGRARRMVSGVGDKKSGALRQYTISSFLGMIPGCTGSFMAVSLYCHGFIGFGGIVATMIATSGDAAFIMLSKFPLTAILLFALLFVLGIVFAPIADWFVKKTGIKTRELCTAQTFHCNVTEAILTNPFRAARKLFQPAKLSLFLAVLAIIMLVGFGLIGPHTWNWGRTTLFILLIIFEIMLFFASNHYIREHIWDHIVKRHLPRIFLWTTLALAAIHFGTEYLNLEQHISNNMAIVLLLAGLIGLIPDSGPHILFVMLFAQGTVPFSVLIASSIVQDGHGLLPMLSISIKNTVYIKLFNLLVGLVVGYALLLIGI